MPSVEAYNQRSRQGMLWEKLRYHESMIRAHTTTHEAIIARHRTALQQCEALLGINETKGEAA